MANQSIPKNWFSDIVDPLLGADPAGEKYVKHDRGYPDLESDFMSLKLDDYWETMKDYIDASMSVDDFKIKYEKVFDTHNLGNGLALMKEAATKSRSIILTNPSELPFQLYSQLIDYTCHFEIVKQYLSSLIKMKSMKLLPLATATYWPHPSSLDYVAKHHDFNVTAVSFLADNSTVVFGDSNGDVNIHSLEITRVPDTLKGHKDEVTSLAVSADGRCIVSGSKDHTVRLWDRSNKKHIVSKVLNSHSDSVSSVSISADGRWIVSGSHDYTVRIWDTCSSPISNAVLYEHKSRVNSVCISGNGRWIVSGSDDYTVRLCDTSTKPISVNVLHRETFIVRCVSVSRDGRWIVWACSDLIRLGESTKKSITISSKSTYFHHLVTSVSLSADGRWFVSGASDGTVRIWHTNTNHSCTKVFHGHTSGIRGVSISSDCRWIVSGSDDRTIRVRHSVASPFAPKKLDGYTDCVRSVSVSGDRRWIVSASLDNTVRLWDSAANSASSKILHGHTDGVTNVAISEYGHWVASDGGDAVHVWDRSCGHLRYVFLVNHEVQSLFFNASNCLVIKFSATSSAYVQMDDVERTCSAHWLNNPNEQLTALIESELSDFRSHPLLRSSQQRRGRIVTTAIPQLSLPSSLRHSQSVKECKPHVDRSHSTKNTSTKKTLSGNSNFHERKIKKSPVVRALNEYINNFNCIDSIPRSRKLQKETMPASGRVRSTRSDVKIYSIRHESLPGRSNPTEVSIESGVTTSNIPFYCNKNLIHDKESNAPIARLPALVATTPNSVIYNKKSKTLVLFLVNGLTCFFRVNETQHELGLDDFMGLQSDMFGTSLSPSDRCLFNYFKQSSSKIRMLNNCTLLDQYSDGIFIGISSIAHKLIRENRFEFKYSLVTNACDSSEITVLVDPYVLTPLGLSILFWMMPISPNNKRLLKAILKVMKLNNCFSDKVTGQQSTGKHTALVIPEQWALEFIHDYDFIVKHSVFGDFGVCIGMDVIPEQSFARTAQPESRHGIVSRFRKSKVLPVLDIVLKETDFNDDMNVDENENVKQKPEIAKLLYREYAMPKWNFQLNGMKFSLPFVEAEFEIAVAKENIGFTSKGRDIIVKSLNRFSLMKMESPHENLFNRMEWLQEAFLNVALFPVGNNRGFLEQIANRAKTGDPMRIFNCCKVPAGTLNERNCRQLRRGGNWYILLPLPRGSANEYLAFSGKADEKDGMLHVDRKMLITAADEELEEVKFDVC